MSAQISSDDTSLQRWGRNLSKIAPLLQEQANLHAKTDAQATEVTAAVGRMASQATNGDLPVAAPVAAEFGSIAAELAKLDAEAAAIAGRRRALAARAEALPTTYRKEHETDEDRLHSPRVSRAAEKRADVSAAERDV